MPVTRTYECPDCHARITVLHMSRDELPPLCPSCDIAPVQQMSAPHIAKAIGKSADQVYRQIEEASEHRAEMVAEQFGESVHETNMKITDLKDNMRQGDIAAVQGPSRSIGQPQPAPAGNMFSDPTAAAEYARSVNTGPAPRSGATSPFGWQAVKANHHVETVRLNAKGRMA